MTANGPDH